MELPRSEHAAMLMDSVADYTTRAADLPRVRRLPEGGDECSPAVWKQMAALGWLGVLVPESSGGLGLSLAEAAIVAEGLAGVLSPEPYTAVAVLSARVLERSHGPMAADLLGGIAAGGQRPVVAWQEAADDFAGLRVETVARPCAGGFRISGSKQFVIGAAGAGGYIVSAQAADGLQLLWVPRDAAGLAVSLLPLADGRRYGSLALRDVQLPQENLLAAGAEARDALDRALDHAAVIVAAELAGVMKRTHALSLEYLKTRVQFGKAIGSFQVLQHRAVDLHIQQSLADAVLQEAVAQLDAEPDAATRAREASRAKSRCADAALAITRAAIQFHGAMGFTEDCDVGLYVKRAMTLAAWLGNGRVHRLRYARLSAVAREVAA